MNLTLSDGKTVEVTSVEATGGPGVVTSHKLMDGDEMISCTTTVTCYYNGKSYSASRECPSCSGNTGDCSNPTNPRVICG
jgi:hypothetical protein